MIILASASPRRKDLLGLITKDFLVEVSDVDESLDPSLTPREAVEQLALRKAAAVFAARPGDIVVGADTIVVCAGEILGKPADAADARRMLRMLSGARHSVYTGVAVLAPGAREIFSEETAVYFCALEEEAIDRYIQTGEPFDKAGAYGIQEKGALFIRRIEGDYYSVMGLPVCRLGKILGEMTGEENNL